MKDRVVVAMSGGVDSSVAACLLKDSGYEVIGLTMCFNLAESAGKRPGCCGPQGIEDAQRVAHKIGIKHYVVNMQKVLAERVIKDFCHQYLRGKTPNPCVRCNQYVKFDALLKKSIALGARFMATGHYAKVSRQKKYFLHKANDLRKDQSYFLYRIGQRQLKHLIFPLGDYTKEEVRALARKFALSVSDKVDSQEICFIPKMSYREFLREHCLECAGTGEVVDKTGKILGRHQGIPYYTLGQRGGLGIAAGYPLYVTNIDARRNRITVGKRDDAYARQFMVGKTHFVSSSIKKKVVLQVKIRYNHKEEKALISPCGSKLKVVFQKPQFAITPGQSAVFYDGDIVVGGGIIERVLN